jgi:hypothetical protein
MLNFVPFGIVVSKKIKSKCLKNMANRRQTSDDNTKSFGPGDRKKINGNIFQYLIFHII